MVEMLTDLFLTPFADYAFMRRALAAGWILALGSSSLGVFMMLRRMSLVGDALSHALLPGVAVAFLVAGLSLWAMTVGGVVAAVLVALCATALVRYTKLKEDAAFTLLYLLSLAVGVALISVKGSASNLSHILFGNILAINEESLYLITSVCCLSLFSMAVLYRRLVIDGFDHDFLCTAGEQRKGARLTSAFFYVLLMINLVAAFQAMGTLMALGLMLLPAITARFWAKTLDGLLPIALIVGVVSVYLGLVVSFSQNIPSGPAIVLVAGSFALISSAVGTVGSFRRYSQ